MPENFEMQADFSIFVRMDRGEIIIYRTADGETRLEVRMESDSVWLTQAQIARLFGVDRTVIVLPFSMASSMVPTFKKAGSGR